MEPFKIKQLFIFAMLITSCFSAVRAQEIYDNFLEEGKTWTYHFEYYFKGLNYDYNYTIQGDTTINGTACKKIYSHNKNHDGLTKYECSLYQKEKMIFMIDNQKSTPTILCNFGLKKGDSMPYGNYSLKVYSVDTLNIENQKIRCLFIYYNDGESSDNLRDGGFWIEGIGNSRDLLFYDPCDYPGYTWNFKNCKLSNGSTFTVADLEALKNKITSIRTIKNDPTKKVAETINLQGMPVNNNFKGIVIKNGEKILQK
jgi:hypothetical protein